jgi:hypothetical protein
MFSKWRIRNHDDKTWHTELDDKSNKERNEENEWKRGRVYPGN